MQLWTFIVIEVRTIGSTYYKKSIIIHKIQYIDIEENQDIDIDDGQWQPVNIDIGYWHWLLKIIDIDIGPKTSTLLISVVSLTRFIHLLLYLNCWFLTKALPPPTIPYASFWTFHYVVGIYHTNTLRWYICSTFSHSHCFGKTFLWKVEW